MKANSANFGRGSDRRPSAEEVLNGMENIYPKVEAPAEEYDPTGFDENALFSLPAPGEHPRILFGPKDIPRIKKNLDVSRAERLVRENCQSLFTSGTFENLAFSTLSSGNIDAYQNALKDPRNPYLKGPPGGGSDPFPVQLRDAAFFALLDGDEKRGRSVAAAVATYASYLRTLAETASKEPGAEHFWLQLRPVIGDSATVALLYDFSHAFMNVAQRETLRELLAFTFRGRYGLGMDLPRHFRNWNFIGMGLYFPLMMLALEGEKGFDQRVVDRGVEVARDYALFGNSKLGTGKEAVGYHTSGVLHQSELLLALAQRGKNYFTLKRFRSMFSNWLIWTMQPWGGQWTSSGDLGNFPPSRSLMKMMRTLFPEDKQIEMIWRNLQPDRPMDFRLGVHIVDLLFPMEPDESAKRTHASAYRPDPDGPIFPAEPALSQFDPERGILWARTGWGAADLSLQFCARNDTTFPSHDFADRGAFYFSALGVPWAISGMRETESKYHSLVTVDGYGQGYFAPPASWCETSESDKVSIGAVDLKYCWDWHWMKASFVADEKQFRDEPWLSPFKESRDRLLKRFPLESWERDPLPQVRDYYEKYVLQDPRMWGHEDSWVIRHKHFPVQKAFRSVALVRGKHPFVLIADDMKVDEAVHVYSWQMMLPPEMEVYSIGGESGQDIVLGLPSGEVDEEYIPEAPWRNRGRPLPKPGQSLLYVKVLEARHDGLPVLRQNPRVETIEVRKHSDEHQFAGRSMGLGKRLVIPSTSVEPDFKVALIPFRSGETLPKFFFDTSSGKAALTWPDHVTRLEFKKGSNGRTNLSFL